ncbi:MAG: ComEA family DNA-binding protein [Armatimonadota bacterium]|nr:ComEA family DNA-binding protein [Armatimonadota bacterium]
MVLIERPDRLALMGLAAALALAALVVQRAMRPPEPVKVEIQPQAALVSVHVAGEVVWPGLYVLKAGSRVQDALFAAHGPTLLADLGRVNLAAPLRDGDRVLIPRIQQPPYPFPAGQARPPTGREVAGPSGSASAAGTAGEPSGTVNVNTATAADLERLPGVGPVLARRIVEHREARGLFRRLDDLLEVQGIGPKVLRRLEPALRLE